mmetsp:Transcript_19088/g.72153  ORF Transcript_19088/g.72153 Transcript_19088/m.72153 type:complete len:268 (+) Transcript_19088:989-1792(+)
MLLEALLGVEPEGLPRLRAPSTACALLRGSPRDWRHEQAFHAHDGVVHLLLDKAGVHNVHHAVDCDGCLRHVRAHHDLPAWSAAGPRRRCGWVEDQLLLLGRQAGEQRVDIQFTVRVWIQEGRAMLDPIHSLIDLCLSREEDEHVARLFVLVYHQDRLDSGVQVVSLRLGRVERLHRERSARHAHQGRQYIPLCVSSLGHFGAHEVAAKLERVQRRRHDNQAEVFALAHDVLQDAHEHVRGQRPFVGLIQDDARVAAEQRVGMRLSQ